MQQGGISKGTRPDALREGHFDFVSPIGCDVYDNNV